MIRQFLIWGIVGYVSHFIYSRIKDYSLKDAIKWTEKRRSLWAMDLLHWAIKMCPQVFLREFLDYMWATARTALAQITRAGL